MYLNYICCIFLVCCRFSQATLTANNVTGYGTETTLFTWSSLGIRPGDLYSITKDLNAIYFSIDEGIIKEGKYSAIAENGAITLTILNTNVSDVGVYECSHNFIRASGFLAVAFTPENVTAVATKLTDEWRMTVSATLVFPMDSTISSVTCSKADSSIAVFATESNAVSPYSDTSYLYVIAWNGTTPEILPEQTQCNITLNIIETVVKTINVSFKGTSISTISTPNSTKEPDSKSEPFQVWCIILICIVVVVVVVGVYKVIAKDFARKVIDKTEGGRPDTGGRGFKSHGSEGKENRPPSATIETTNEALLETKPPQTTVQCGYQLNDQAIKQRQLLLEHL